MVREQNSDASGVLAQVDQRKATTTIAVLWKRKHKQLWKSGARGEKPHK